METIKLDDIKQSEGWKHLNEYCPRFGEKVNKFLNEAYSFVKNNSFNCVEGSNNNESEVINYEIYNDRSNKVVLSYISKPINRDLDCQFKIFKKIEFYIDEYTGNFIINELSGKVESKYGYSFENSDARVLITNYSYQVFSKEGIELSYRGYSDKFMYDSEEYFEYDNLRTCVCEGFNPHLQDYDGNKTKAIYIGKYPNLIERYRSQDNLGLVREINSTFGKNGEKIVKTDKHHFNTFIGFNDDVDPFLIHINRGILPLTESKNNELNVHFIECGATKNNYKEVARTRFGMELNNKINELIEEEKEIPVSDKKNLTKMKMLLEKYNYLYHIIQLDKWIWKDINDNRTIRK